MTTLEAAAPDLEAAAEATPPPAPAPEAPALARLRSLDALRGFDMFWIVGGEQLAKALAKYTHSYWLGEFCRQLEHPRWNGFALYDLIFPLFLFISGVTMPFSIVRRVEAGGSLRSAYLRALRRGLLLVFLGLVCNGLLRFEFAKMRYPSVLGRIGLAYMLAAFLVLRLGRRTETGWRARPAWIFACVVALLLGYWAALVYIPVPGVGAGVLTQEGWLGGYIDRHVLPGTLYRGVHDPEGLLSTIPAIGTALLGVLTGFWLRAARPHGVLKVLAMAAIGYGLFRLGWAWDSRFPINKNMWSSSFVVLAGGYSLMLLAGFYLVIDVIGLWRWAFVFIVIGLNPITIYVARGRFIDFGLPARTLFEGATRNLGEDLHQVVAALAVLLMEWLFLFFLYRKKTFLRV
jgi:predicted acyltransferase